jgi:uncharacterized protein
MRSGYWIAGIAAMLASASSVTSARAAETAPGGGTLLTVVAEGRVARAPDLADIGGGVVSDAPTAQAAMADNARAMAAVLAAVRRAGVADRDIQTRGVSLQPQYRYDQNQPPALTGYQASNTISIRVRKLADAGRLLDTLVAAGANQLSGPDFRVEAADAALDEARAAAVAMARARALLYARAAGLTVKRIVSLAEAPGSEPGPRPMMMAKAAMADATPVVPGEVALAVSVTVQFELQ